MGKTPGGRGARQDDIHALLIERASEGRSVVRLKGGDPFVFGRGGEEAIALSQRRRTLRGRARHNVRDSRAGLRGHPRYPPRRRLGRHLRHRLRVARQIRGRRRLAALARTRGTLVVLMGWRSLESAVAILRSEGLPDDTPAALVEWATGPRQRTVTGVLADIVEQGRAQGLGPPVVAVFGGVAALREDIRWFDNRPLFGKRVLVTRSRTQAGVLARLLEVKGAEVMEIPTIRIAAATGATPSSTRRSADCAASTG